MTLGSSVRTELCKAGHCYISSTCSVDTQELSFFSQFEGFEMHWATGMPVSMVVY